MSPFINKSENYTASHISVYLGKCLNQPFNQWVLWYITKFRYKLYYSKHFWHYRRTYNLCPDCITMKKDNIYSWLNIINVSLTTKFLPFPVYCFVSVFSCCSPWCQSNFLLLTQICLVFSCVVNEGNATSFSCWYNGCLLFVLDNCRFQLLSVIGAFMIFRRIIGN